MHFLRWQPANCYTIAVKFVYICMHIYASVISLSLYAWVSTPFYYKSLKYYNFNTLNIALCVRLCARVCACVELLVENATTLPTHKTEVVDERMQTRFHISICIHIMLQLMESSSFVGCCCIPIKIIIITNFSRT